MKLHNVLLGLIKLRPSVLGYELKTIITKSTQYFFSAFLNSGEHNTELLTRK